MSVGPFFNAQHLYGQPPPDLPRGFVLFVPVGTAPVRAVTWLGDGRRLVYEQPSDGGQAYLWAVNLAGVDAERARAGPPQRLFPGRDPAGRP